MACVISAFGNASATDELDAARLDASHRLTDLKRAEDRLSGDIDICNQQIAAYQHIAETKRTALQQVQYEIRTIQVAFKFM